MNHVSIRVTPKRIDDLVELLYRGLTLRQAIALNAKIAAERQRVTDENKDERLPLPFEKALDRHLSDQGVKALLLPPPEGELLSSEEAWVFVASYAGVLLDTYAQAGPKPPALEQIGLVIEGLFRWVTPEDHHKLAAYSEKLIYNAQINESSHFNAHAIRELARLLRELAQNEASHAPSP